MVAKEFDESREILNFSAHDQKGHNCYLAPTGSWVDKV